MRFLITQALMITSALALATTSQAQTAANIGDCLTVSTIDNCRSYLTAKGAKEGIDYLEEKGCPGCVLGNKSGTNPDGSPTYHIVCPEGHNLSNPIDENLATANMRYHLAGTGETGATVTEFKKRVCWQGGECVVGLCDWFDSGAFDAYGKPIDGYKCYEAANSISYVIKIIGNACTDDMYGGGQGPDADPNADPNQRS